MEHRCTGRHKATRDALIHTTRGQSRKGLLRDVSKEGMYIETEVQDIRKGETVDIEVTSDCCIKGWVVRIGDEGVGVAFFPPQTNAADSPSPPIPLPNTCLKCLKFDDS